VTESWAYRVAFGVVRGMITRWLAAKAADQPTPEPWTHRFAWRSGPLGPNPVREQLHGRRCCIALQGGSMGTVVLLVEGFGLVATSRRALRRLPPATVAQP
jgi:hypothetical protein